MDSHQNAAPKRDFASIALVALVFLSVLALIVSLSGCVTPAYQQRADAPQQRAEEQELTVGKVQKEIRKGMSGAEVAQALGSPNIVTKDEGGMETWVYDRIATEASYTESREGLLVFFYGRSDRSGSVSVTQKTLTVVVKFNAQSRVDTFSYHASKF